MLDDIKKYSEAWNFGPEDCDVLSVEDILKASIKVWNKGKYSIDLSEQPHEANLLKLDISKAKTKLKWKPVYNSNDAVYETIDWYIEFYEKDNNKMKEFTRNQINQYVRKATKNNILWALN